LRRLRPGEGIKLKRNAPRLRILQTARLVDIPFPKLLKVLAGPVETFLRYSRKGNGFSGQTGLCYSRA